MQQVVERVKEILKNAESGHDWSHMERVRKLAVTIAKSEIEKGRSVNLDIVELGALLHDIADHKFHNGDEEIGPKLSREILTPYYPEEVIQRVDQIIRKISFKGNQVENKMDFLEGFIVQDADRLDALGAIGIARCFTYGGFKNRTLYDPNIPPQQHNNFEQYKNAQSTTINHFYEKLLLLKDMMNTQSGRQVAEQRHQVMIDFLDQFKAEWEGQR